MMGLLPQNDRPGTTFMNMFLLSLSSEMRDHLIAKKISKTVHSWLNMQTGYPTAPSPLSTRNLRWPSTPCPAVTAGIFLSETSNKADAP